MRSHAPYCLARPRRFWQGFAFAGMPPRSARTNRRPRRNPSRPRRQRRRQPMTRATRPSLEAQRRATPVDLGPPEDPVVAALLSSNPTTPSEIFHTAQLLLEASRPELAKQYLQKLLDARLDDGQWSALVDEYHTPAFTDLAGRTELRPENEQVVQAALGAMDRRLRDPARLADGDQAIAGPVAGSPRRGIGQAAAGARRGRRCADRRLGRSAASGRAPGRPPCAGRHAGRCDRSAGRHHRTRRPRTYGRGDPKPWPRCGPRRRPSISTRRRWPRRATCRSARPARAAIRQLQGALPTAAQAAQQLYELARSYLAGKQPIRTDMHGRVTLWTWDAAAKQCVERSCPPDEAARAFAARLARAARSLEPENRAAQTLAIAAELEQLVYDRGLDKGLDFNDSAVKRLAATDPSHDGGRAGVLPERAPRGRRAGGGRNPRPLREDAGSICKAARDLRRWSAPFAVRTRGSAWRRLEAIVSLQPDDAIPRFELRAGGAGVSGRVNGRPPRAGRQPQQPRRWRNGSACSKLRNIESDTATSGARGRADGLALP